MNITALGIATLNSQRECIEVFYNWISLKEKTYEMIAKKYERKGNFQIRLDSLKTDMESLDDLLTPNIALQNLFSNQTLFW